MLWEHTAMIYCNVLYFLFLLEIDHFYLMMKHFYSDDPIHMVQGFTEWFDKNENDLKIICYT